MTKMISPTPSLAQPMDSWLNHLRFQRRYSAHTLIAYHHDLQRLKEFADALLVPLEELTREHIRHFASRLHAQGLGPRSLARTLAAWRGFYKWWTPNAGLTSNPVAGVRAPKAPRGLPKALSVEQAQVLLDSPHAQHTNEPTAFRDVAMFELFYSSGLRLSELVSLDYQYVRTADYESAGWINAREAEVVVLGKGGKTRAVPVGQVALAAIQHWLNHRSGIVSAHDPDAYALFLGVRGRRISPRVVQAQLAKFAQQAGLPVHVHPHVLRHSFASHILQSAQDLRAVQEMLGHANITTTQIYTRLDFQHLAKAYDQAHPRAGRKS